MLFTAILQDKLKPEQCGLCKLVQRHKHLHLFGEFAKPGFILNVFLIVQNLMVFLNAPTGILEKS